MNSSDRTEKPTPRRLREARREGRVPKSQEVAVAASMVSALVALRAFGPGAARSVVEDTRLILGIAGSSPSGAAVRSLAFDMLISGILPALAVAAALGTAAAVAQVGFVYAPKAAKPKLSNLSPKKGLQRFKPDVAGWELARSALKLTLLGAVAWEPVTSGMTRIAATRSLDRSLQEVGTMIGAVLLRAGLLALLIALADYTINRVRSTKQLKMTRQEVKQEAKDSEGDPHIRAQRRRRATEMSRNRIINVATADVVVTNPTHYAVAIAYRPPEPAPRVVAKGTDGRAKRIRKEAYRHGVPVIEHRPLARALYRKAKVGMFIPTALYEATAVVLAAAYRRTRRRPA